MLAKLTKEQVARLSPEQQEVVARLAIDEGRRRRLVLSRARGYRGYNVAPWLVLFGGIFFWEQMMTSGWILPILACFGFALIHFHASGINSRIDAVLDLFEEENAKSKNNAEEVVAQQPAARSGSDFSGTLPPPT